MKHAGIIGMLAAATVGLVTVVGAQNGPAAGGAPPLIIGASGNMTPIVGNLEEAAKFYSDLVGLVSPPPIRRRSHKDVPYPEVLKNQGTPDATIRQINLNVPGSPWKLEVLEFTDIDRTPSNARPQDP